eukprot:43151-Pyramimonas_sp.AAC.1
MSSSFQWSSGQPLVLRTQSAAPSNLHLAARSAPWMRPPMMAPGQLPWGACQELGHAKKIQ